MGYFRYSQANRTNNLLSRILRRINGGNPSSVRLRVTLPTGNDDIYLEVGSHVEYQMETTLETGATVTTNVKISCLDIN